LDSAGGGKLVRIAANDRCRGWIILDEGCGSSAARQRLEAQRSAAGEEVRNAQVVE